MKAKSYNSHYFFYFCVSIFVYTGFFIFASAFPFSHSVAQSAQSSAQYYLTLRGKIHNQSLNLTWRTDCYDEDGIRLLSGTTQVNSETQGTCVGDSYSEQSNKVFYDNTFAELGGRATSEFTGANGSIFFTSVKPSSNLADCPVRPGARPIIKRFEGDEGEEDKIRIIGCAYFPLFNVTILLSPYNESGNKISLTGQQNSLRSSWEGVSVLTFSGDVAGQPPVFSLHGCGWDYRLPASTGINTKFYIFDKSKIGASNFDCNDVTLPTEVQTAESSTSTELVIKNTGRVVPDVKTITPSVAAPSLNQIVSYDVNCGRILSFPSSKAELINKFLEALILAGSTQEETGILQSLLPAAIKSFILPEEQLDGGSIIKFSIQTIEEITEKLHILSLPCIDQHNVFVGTGLPPSGVVVRDAFISSFTINRQVIPSPKEICISFAVKNFNTAEVDAQNLTCGIYEVGNQNPLFQLNKIETGTTTKNFRYAVLRDSKFQTKCTYNKSGAVKKLNSDVKNIKVLASELRERVLDKKIGSLSNISIQNSRRAQIPTNADRIEVYDFEENLIGSIDGDVGVSVTVPLGTDTGKYLYAIPINTKTGTKGVGRLILPTSQTRECVKGGD